MRRTRNGKVNKKIAERYFKYKLLGYPISCWWKRENEIEDMILKKYEKKRAYNIIRCFYDVKESYL